MKKKITIGLLLISNIMYSQSFQKIKDNNSFNQPKKVAILVARVGNTKVIAPMSKISLKTDYSIRIPKSGNCVFIDDEKRLAESVPAYPKFAGNTQGTEHEYFKNITPEIFEALKMSFEQKAYEVFDFRQISNSWDKPFSETTVREIITTLGEEVDFLFIFHYLDAGNSSVNSEYYKVKASTSGFSTLLFTYTLFDVKKQKKVFSYSPLVGFTRRTAIVYNPEVMNNPELRKKINVDCTENSQTITTEISIDFTESELIDLALEIIINGLQCEGKKFIDCLDECIFPDIKSLMSKIP